MHRLNLEDIECYILVIYLFSRLIILWDSHRPSMGDWGVATSLSLKSFYMSSRPSIIEDSKVEFRFSTGTRTQIFATIQFISSPLSFPSHVSPTREHFGKPVWVKVLYFGYYTFYHSFYPLTLPSHYYLIITISSFWENDDITISSFSQSIRLIFSSNHFYIS